MINSNGHVLVSSNLEELKTSLLSPKSKWIDFNNAECLLQEGSKHFDIEVVDVKIVT